MVTKVDMSDLGKVVVVEYEGESLDAMGVRLEVERRDEAAVTACRAEALNTEDVVL